MEQRRYPRFKTSPAFKIKARLRVLGQKKTFYLKVETLSMGGLSLNGDEDQIRQISETQDYEVMLFHQQQSLKMLIKIVAVRSASDILTSAGAKIVGIDEESRKMLADFLQKLNPIS